jgi:Reverse transcriptase (RNA-dependent DNA polymerase)
LNSVQISKSPAPNTADFTINIFHANNLIIYVDEILVLTEYIKVMLSVKKQLSKMYTVKDLGEAEYFLVVKIERETSTVKLTQTSYVKSVHDRTGILECKPAQTPMSDPVSLMITQPRTEAEVSQMKDVPFREAIGLVLYIAMRTRPDIAVAVSILLKHVQEPRPAHWEGVKRILRYLKGTMTQGLQYESVPGEQNSLSIHCDADWGTDPEDRRSRTGVVCRMGGNVVSWTSRKQTKPVVSNCEAEYAALFEARRNAVWIRSFLCEVGHCPGKVPTLITLTKVQSCGLKADCSRSNKLS